MGLSRVGRDVAPQKSENLLLRRGVVLVVLVDLQHRLPMSLVAVPVSFDRLGFLQPSLKGRQGQIWETFLKIDLERT